MSDTKVCNTCGVDKALTEFNKRSRSSDGLSSYCRQCKSAVDAKHYAENREKIKRQTAAYAKANREQSNRSKKKWRDNNPDIQAAAVRACKEAKPEFYRGIRNDANARRRAAKIQATPEWADKKVITDIYKEAQRLQQVLGIPMHIDHVVPLQGELVCGLHVEYNLQVIPAALNLRKSNKFKVQ